MRGDAMDKNRQVGTEAENVTLPQIERIISFFGNHTMDVMDVSVDYDPETGHLKLSDIPSDPLLADVAREALERAISSAQTIHPSDNLDMSA
jgi:hypothetical protein